MDSESGFYGSNLRFRGWGLEAAMREKLSQHIHVSVLIPA